MIKNSQLAKKYARAFLNLYDQELTESYYTNLNSLRIFLLKNRWLYFYLSISSISNTTKQQAIKRVGDILKFCSHTTTLINTLLKHNRIELLDDIIDQILSIHELRQNSETFTVSSSHELTKEEQSTVEQLIKRSTKKNIKMQYIIDPKLICGLKIESKHMQWERSVARQLKIINQDVLQRISL